MRNINNRYSVQKEIKNDDFLVSYVIKDEENKKRYIFYMLRNDLKFDQYVSYIVEKYKSIKNLNFENMINLIDVSPITIIDGNKLEKMQYGYILENYDYKFDCEKYINNCTNEQKIKIFMEICAVVNTLNINGYVFDNLELKDIKFISFQNDSIKLKIKNILEDEIKKINLYSTSINMQPFPYNIENGRGVYSNFNNLEDLYSIFLKIFDTIDNNYNLSEVYEIKKFFSMTHISNNNHTISGFIKYINKKLNKNYPVYKESNIDKIKEDIDLIGREEEIKIVERNYKRVLSNKKNNSFLCFMGESGTGKSYFLNQIKNVIRCKFCKDILCFENAEYYINKDFSEIINKVILKCSADDNSIMFKYKNYIDSFINYIIGKDADLNEIQQYKMINRLVEYIKEKSRENSMVILIDDLEKCPDIVRKLIYYILCGNIGIENVMIIFTTNESAWNEEFIKYFNKINRVFEFEKYTLNYFNQYNTKKMISNILGYGKNIDKISLKIYNVTFGNPQYIFSVIKELYKSKKIYFDYNKEKWTTIDNLTHIPIPSDIEEKVDKMINDLDENHLKILKNLSIFSSSLSEQVIFDNILKTNNQKAIYNDLKARRLITDKISDRGLLVGFTNDLLRNVLYTKLNESEKEKLHKEASVFLEEEAKKDEIYTKEFMHNLIKTDNAKKLFYYLNKCAEKEYENGNNNDAIKYYEEAIKYCDDERECEVAINIAKLYENISSHKKSLQYFKYANDYAVKYNLKELDIYTLLEILIIKINDQNFFEEDIDSYLKNIRDKLDKVKFTEGEVYYYYAVILKCRIECRYDDVISYGNKALSLYSTLKKPTYICGWILNTLASIYLRRDSREVAKLMIIRATNIFYKSNNKNGYLFSKNAYTELSCEESGEYEKAIQQFIEIERLSQKEGLYKREVIAIENIAMCYLILKDYKNSEKYYLTSIQKQKEQAVNFYSENTYSGLCLLYVLSENNELAIRYHQLMTSSQVQPDDTSLRININRYITEYYYNLSFHNYKKAYEFIKEIYMNVCNRQDERSINFICAYYLFLLSLSKNNSEMESIYYMLYNYMLKLGSKENKIFTNLKAIIIMAEKGDLKFAKSIFDKLNYIPVNYNLEAYYIYIEFIFGIKESYAYLINKALRVCNLRIDVDIRNKLYECIADNYVNMKCYELAFQYYYESITLHIEKCKNLSEEESVIYINNSGFLKLYKKFINCINKKMKIKIKFKNFDTISSYEELKILYKEISLTRLISNNYIYSSMQNLYEKLYYNDLSDIYNVFERFDDRVVNNLENIMKYLARVTLADKAVLISENGAGIEEVICNYRFSNMNMLKTLLNSKLELQDNIAILKKNNIFPNKGTDGIAINANDIKACFYMRIRNNETYMSSTNKVNAKLVFVASNSIYNINKNSKKILEKFRPFILFLLEKYNLTINSTLDKLTGCYNRKYFEENLLATNQSLKNSDEQFGVIMFDIDDFKGVNDKFGHQTGDEVLIKIIREVSKCTLKTDIIGRYGGEEFLILVSNTNKEKILNLAEKIRKNIDNARILGNKRKVTVSIGVTLVEESNLSNDEIIARVDRALYKSKNTGKNKVTFWDENCVSTNENKDMNNSLFSGDARNYKSNLVVSDMLNLIKQEYSKDEKIRTFLNEMIMTVNCQSGAVYLVEDEKIKQYLVVDKKYKEDSQKIFVNEELIKKCVSERKNICVIDWENIIYNDNNIPNWESLCITPVIFNGKVIAVLYLSNYINNREFTNNDCMFLSSLGQLSIPIFL